MASSFTNFTGKWEGACVVNGVEKPSKKSVNQIDDLAIEINGMKFDLTKPTVVTLDSEEAGFKYREITVYDWQWNETKTILNTSARWVGYYLDKPGAWSGEGVGLIKIDGTNLITTRKFGSVDEICSYSRDRDR